VPAGLSNVVAVAGGGSHSLALLPSPGFVFGSRAAVPGAHYVLTAPLYPGQPALRQWYHDGVLIHFGGTLAITGVQAADLGQYVAVSRFPFGQVTNAIIRLRFAPDLQTATLDTPLEAWGGSTQPISWTVVNRGHELATGAWVDRVYLSEDTLVGNDRLVGEFPASGPLPTNQPFPHIQSILLPADLKPDRDYWWIVVTDAGNAIEEENEANNARVSDHPMRLLATPTPNLRVASVSTSANPMSGQPAVVTWSVINAGTWNTGAGLWQDAVYLSATTNVDATAVLLGRATRPRPLGTNESYAGTLTANLAQGLSGTRYFIVQTDSDNRVNEGVFENDNITASAPVSITLTLPPDLQVAAIQAPTSALSGETITVAWTVTNAGPGVTAEAMWFDEVYVSPVPALGTNAILLGSFPHDGVLPNGQFYHDSAPMILPVFLSGTYYLLVHTDARSNVFEHVFETNNITASVLPIVITLTPPPDLAVSQVTAPLAALAGHALSVSYTVTNRGPAAAQGFPWEDRLYLTTNPPPYTFPFPQDSGGARLLASDWRFGALDIGDSYTNTLDGVVPDGLSGAWYAVVATDCGGEVFELVKTNNSRASPQPIQVESRPADLVVPGLIAPSAAQAGGGFLASWSVKNQGNGDTVISRWSDRLVLSADPIAGNADDVTLLTLNHDDLLPAGGGYTVSNSAVTVPFSVGPGSYRLFLIADNANVVYEGARELNNASSPALLSITRTTADLRVGLVTCAPLGQQNQGGVSGGSPIAVLSEDSLTVQWRVENVGAASPNSGTWSDAVYLSTNVVLDASAFLLGTRQNPAPLAPGGAYTNTLTVTLPAEIYGEFYLLVQTDAEGEIIEDGGKANNVLAAFPTLQVLLRPVPDLAVTAVTAPADGFSGQFFEVSWTVTNRGPAAAEGTWFDSVYLSLDQQFDPGLDIYIGYAERPQALTNGQSYTQTAWLEIPPEVSGLFQVFVRCDSTGRVNERGATTNNLRRAPLPVAVWAQPPADLVVGAITIPSNGVSGQEVAMTYTLRNQGTNAASGSWLDSIYLSADEQWDLGDLLFARVGQSGVLVPGGSRTQTATAPVPGLLPGDYHVIIRTDLLNSVPETDESNNVGGSLDRVATEVWELVVDVPATNQLVTGRALYYRVRVPAGQWLVIAFESGSPSAATELYASYQAVPSRDQFQCTDLHPLQANHRLVIPNTQAGDYFIVIYGAGVDSPTGTSCILSARFSQFLVLDTDFGVGGNAGNLTVPINGANLDRSCTAFLTNEAGLNQPAVSHYYEGGTRLYATFNLRGLAPGTYSAIVRNGDGSTVIVPNSLRVVEASAPPAVLPLVNAPSVLRRNVAYTFTVLWGNNSLNDAPVPLLTVGNTVPFGLKPGDYSLGTSYTFLGVNNQDGPPGILRPGQSGWMTFHSFSETNAGTNTVFADRVGKKGNDPMDWDRVLANLPSDDLARTNFQGIWGQFTNQIGGRWDDYLKMLARNATLLPPALGDLRSPAALERLEWRRALTAQTLSISGRITSDSMLVAVGNVEVVAVPQTGPSSGVTWSLTDGTFFLPDMRPAQHSLEARTLEGQQLAPVVADVSAGSSVTNLVLDLSLGATLELEVSDTSGVPIGGALITIGHLTNQLVSTVTDGLGRARVAGLPDGLQPVFVEDIHHAPLLTTVESAEYTVTSIHLTLGKGAAIAGEVRLINAQPATNAMVFLKNRQEPVRLSQVARTGPDGRFSASGLADGTYDLTIVAPAGGAHTNLIQLTDAAPLDLGVVTLPDRPAQAHAPKDGDCADYTGGNLVLQDELAKLEDRVRVKLFGVLGARGYDYALVVRDYLNNCYPTLPRIEFSDGSPVVESKQLGLGGVGFRQSKDTEAILDLIMGKVTLRFKNQPDLVSVSLLSDQHQQVWSLDQILTGPDHNYIHGVGGFPKAAIPEPIDGYWQFGNTLAGGMGAYGQPGGSGSPIYPDTRTVTGWVVARPIGKDLAQLTLEGLEFSVFDAFDFIPGDLGTIFMQEAITRDLQYLEFWNYAYDIELFIHWKYDQPIRSRVIRIPELPRTNDFNQPTCPSYCYTCEGPNPPDYCSHFRVVASVDPNDIVGPSAFGPEHWVDPDRTLHYTIRFENDPKKADAPAQYVRVTQKLDPNLDLRTFRLGSMGFGTNAVDVPVERVFFQTQVNVTNELGVVVNITAGLDFAKGEVTWEFTAIDPATGDLPWDPYLGFLPPDTNGIVGQGFVTYTIRPKAGIASGDIINAQARIFFDYNEPMDTPRIFNTVDASLPASSVLSLPATTNRNICSVRWAGADAFGGAGVGSFDIYVSDNGGPWNLWLQNTPSTEQIFVGECGHLYGFYSVARDNVGNREPAVAIAQAQIYVLPNSPPELVGITNRLMAVGQLLSVTNRATEPDAGQHISFRLSPDAPAGMTIDPVTGVLKWSPACVQGGTSNWVTVIATDDGCGTLSSARSFGVLVTECLQTSLGRTASTAGDAGCIPLSVESSSGLTNLAFILSVPPGRFTNFAVVASAPEVGSATVVLLNTTQALVTLAAQPGQVLQGPKHFADLCFSLVPDQASAFVPIEVQDILGLKESGTPIGNTSGSPGRTAVVSEDPLLECVHGPGGQPSLLLYARPGWTCALDGSGGIGPGMAWQEVTRVAPSNLVTALPLVATNGQVFYRTLRR
jgi:hypothetical protein